jgi:hypothetical protein
VFSSTRQIVLHNRQRLSDISGREQAKKDRVPAGWECKMNNFRVSFYKELCNSDGHRFKCLQRQVEVQSDDPSGAMLLAERLVDNERLNADCVEVVLLTGHHTSEHFTFHSPDPCKHIWNRVA